MVLLTSARGSRLEARLSDVSTCARKGWYTPRGGEQQFNNTKLKSWRWAGGGVDQASCLVTQSFVGPQGGRRPRQLAGGGRGSEGIPVRSEEKKKKKNDRGDLRWDARRPLAFVLVLGSGRICSSRAKGGGQMAPSFRLALVRKSR